MTSFETTEELIAQSILNYSNHPSIVAIKDKVKDSFSFEKFSSEEIGFQIKKLDLKKSTQNTDLPTKLLVENCDQFSIFFELVLNNSLKEGIFPGALKVANITPVFKKGSKLKLENYRPVSILSNISKVFERCIYSQLNSYFEKFLSDKQCGFRNRFSSQHCLLAMIEKWRYAVDNNEYFGALLTDLSKAFDSIDHKLLIAKLAAFGLDSMSLKFLASYLLNRKHRTKIDNDYSEYAEILFGVPQGSILGPLLFNIYICDLFFIINDLDMASFADDTTPYFTGPDIITVKQNLEQGGVELFKWFSNNFLKSNSEKSHVLFSSKELQLFNVCDSEIESSHCEKLLGITLEKSLNFDYHVDSLCKKASQKLHALSRISTYMDINQRKLIVNSFIQSHFNYCPLVWMFHSRRCNAKINRIHERALRLIYNDHISSFPELLSNDKSFTIHERNLQYLAIEIFKYKNDLSPTFMKLLFNENTTHYDLRNKSEFSRRKIRSVRNGSETIANIAPQIWDLVPDSIKKSPNLYIFQSKIKLWKTNECPCRICKTFIPELGFI